MKAAAGQAVSYRNYRRARDRALTKLATAHFEHYKELLEKEKAFDEQMGKKWLDINGTTAASLVDTRSDSTPALAGQTDKQRENAGDNGGEA
jgi:hypothetical protein